MDWNQKSLEIPETCYRKGHVLITNEFTILYQSLLVDNTRLTVHYYQLNILMIRSRPLAQVDTIMEFWAFLTRTWKPRVYEYGMWNEQR